MRGGLEASKRLSLFTRSGNLPAAVVFDSHLHIVDPRFPLVANRGFLPAPFTVADYRERTRHLGIDGGAVVSGSFQAYDQTYLLDALGRLGPRFAGVAQVPPEIADEDVLALAGAFADSDVGIVVEALGEELARCALHDNAATLDLE
jgi:predicted TIM-barrel fold metal-dependent hydrolase